MNNVIVRLPPRRRVRHPTMPAIEAALDAPALHYHGDKKYVLNLRVTFDRLPEIDLEKVGYIRPESKLRQLRHHYLNEVEVERVAMLIRDRKESHFTSIGMSFHGNPKSREDSQGWCIESMALVIVNGKCRATVFYRTTELITKFAADLVFLREVFSRLDIEPVSVEFHFAVAQIAMVHLPTLFVSTSPIGFLERLRESDRTLWTNATWYLNRYLDGPPINFGPALRQGKLLLRTMSDDQRDALRSYLSEHGRATSLSA